MDQDKIKTAILLGRNRKWNQLKSLGKDYWNIWAEDEENRNDKITKTIDFHIHEKDLINDFYSEIIDLIFPCKVSFNGLKDRKNIYFRNCKFLDDFIFEETETEVSIHFNNCTFSGQFKLDKTKFKNDFSCFSSSFEDFSVKESIFIGKFQFFENNVKGSSDFSKSA